MIPKTCEEVKMLNKLKNLKSKVTKSGANTDGTTILVPLLAFTYFFAVSFYILLLSFYFWNWNKDIKPAKTK